MHETLYSPYGSLDALLAAAGVSVSELSRYTTAELLSRAKARTAETTQPTPQIQVQGGKLPPEGEPYVIRSFRMAYSTENALKAAAKARGLHVSTLGVIILRDWIERNGS